MRAELTLSEIADLLPPRGEASHKGDFGHLLVLAGARGFTGAAKLTCRAAQRSGVGLVTCGIPYPLGNVFSTTELETMTLRLPAAEDESFAREAADPALRFAAKVQAVALGPGITQVSGTRDFVHQFAVACAAPLVIDADGLNALAERPETLSHRSACTVLTPHPGEMARLAAVDTVSVQQDREGTARSFTEAHRCVVVLKGHRTIIAAPDGRVAVNPTGNHGLAKGGSGDVLAGLIGGLLAQGLEGYAAACLGVYVHGLAADLVAARVSPRGMIASDVIEALPEAWRRIEAREPIPGGSAS